MKYLSELKHISNKDKLIILEQTLKDKDLYNGICNVINNKILKHFNLTDNEFAYNVLYRCFPELYEFKPIDRETLIFWFERDDKGYEERKIIIKKLIERTKLLIDKE